MLDQTPVLTTGLGIICEIRRLLVEKDDMILRGKTKGNLMYFYFLTTSPCFVFRKFQRQETS